MKGKKSPNNGYLTRYFSRLADSIYFIYFFFWPLSESADFINYRVITKNDVLQKRPITLSKWTTAQVVFLIKMKKKKKQTLQILHIIDIYLKASSHRCLFLNHVFSRKDDMSTGQNNKLIYYM